MSNLTLDTILNSKTYVPEKAGLAFRSPKEYIEPFLEIVRTLTNEFKVEVSGRTANANEDASVNESFARVKIEAQLPAEYQIMEHTSVIGMVYGLDTAKPVMKLYSGRNAWSCTNLAIFNADHLMSVEMMQGIAPIYEKAKSFSAQAADHIKEFAEKVQRMKNRERVGKPQIDEVVGGLVRLAIANKAVGTTPILNATQALYDKNNVYAIRDERTTDWNIFSAVTQYITDKVDIVDKATKTLYVSGMFDTINQHQN